MKRSDGVYVLMVVLAVFVLAIAIIFAPQIEAAQVAIANLMSVMQ